MRNTSITIRGLEPKVKRKLRLRAAAHGRSMEAEAREILSQVLAEPERTGHLVDQIRTAVSRVGYLELEPPSREPVDEPPEFQ